MKSLCWSIFSYRNHGLNEDCGVDQKILARAICSKKSKGIQSYPYKLRPIKTPSLVSFNLRSVGFCYFQSLILWSARFLIVRFRLVTKSRGISLNKVRTFFQEIFVNILVLKILCEKVKNRKVFFFNPFIQIGGF